MSFWRKISPRGAVNDFVEEWRRPQPYRWQVLGVAVALTFAIMMLFIPKSERAEPEHPRITYISTFDDKRSQAEIIASNLENQKRKEQAEAEEAARIERRKELYRALGRATGLDVDEMEREIARDEAAEAAAKARALEEARGSGDAPAEPAAPSAAGD